MDHEVRVLFHELIDLPLDERTRILSERSIDARVRAEVESLLGFDGASDRDLTASVGGAAQALLRAATASPAGFCGPYRLVRLLGSGGMGSVYLGERSDGELQQTVAIKMLGPAGNRPEWRERFLRERQLLASLNHPSIVHVIDAGHTTDRGPYLVMEFVEGVPIDAYAADIGMRDRLNLFLRVCDGVAHAHSHLIIHRDLKPSNILVDPTGQPKVLDFGIAKLLDDTRDATQTIDRLLTPNYASPEQVRGAVQTTATDIYSLGAVLYGLLTGHAPKQNGNEVPPPSRVNRDVPSDLDYIVRKAMRDEPEARYASVDAFAADIRAGLESRPVSARSGNAWYRARKFLRRYWIPVAAASLAIAGLATGLYVANRERALAEHRFQQVRQLANQVLALDNTIQALPGATKARHQIVSTSLAYLAALGAEARRDPDLSIEIGNAYLQVARVQGVPTGSNLGDFDEADKTLAKGEAFIDDVLRLDPTNRRALRTSAEIAEDRMILGTGWSGDRITSQAHKAASRLDALLSREATPADNSAAARIYTNIAQAYGNLGMQQEAIPVARRAAQLAQADPSAQRIRGSALAVLANALRFSGDLEGALRAIRDARVAVETAPDTNPMLRMNSLDHVLGLEGSILANPMRFSLDRQDEAIAVLRQAFDNTERMAAQDPNDSRSRFNEAEDGTKLAALLRDRDPQRALAIYDLCLRRIRETKVSANRQINEAASLAASSYPLRSLHRPDEAWQRIETAFSVLRETGEYPSDHLDAGSTGEELLEARGDAQEASGQFAAAAATYQDLLSLRKKAKSDPQSSLTEAFDLSRIYAALSRIDREIDDPAGANRFESARREIWQYWDRRLPDNPAIRRQLDAAPLP